MLATAHCDLANIRQALANGADINHYDNGFTPLYYAVSNAAAISHGVHLNVTIFNDPMECVKYLLDHGANPNARYGDQPTDSPLSIAGSWEDIALTKILLAHGAIPTQHDIDRSRGISKVLMERAVLGP
jgi:ankyrin repeat protein